MKSVNIRIPDDLHQAVKELAKESHRSLNGQILACLELCAHGTRTKSGADAMRDGGSDFYQAGDKGSGQK